MEGHIVRVIEISDMEKEFLSHQFDAGTRKILFFAQFHIDYCGG